jgi:hypothetical protein
MMDNREFVLMAKRYAVDEIVQMCVNRLKTPQLPKSSAEPRGPAEESITRWLNYHSAVEQRRSEWFNRLAEDEQKMIRSILEECAEMALANFFCLVDGVQGNYKGVFEIVAVEGNRRKVLNPEDAEMLHDILSDICEENRQGNL